MVSKTSNKHTPLGVGKIQEVFDILSDMHIKLIESDRKFYEEDIMELEGLLSRLPYKHLESLNRIERVFSLNDVLADSSP